MIVGLLFFRGTVDVETARTQAIAVTVSGVLQLAWLIWSCRQAGVVLRLRRPRLSPAVPHAAEADLAGRDRRGRGAVQPAGLDHAGRALPAAGIGLVPYYADRLNQLPLG
jgi:putative peptidoglycan lipid II flippase